MNRLMALLLALATVLLVLLAAAMLGGAGRATALPHPAHAPMRVGIDAGELGAPIWASYLVGVAVLGTMWVTMLIGFRRGHWIHRAVSAWMVGYVLLFVVVMWSFDAYAAGEAAILLGFTAPTSVLVYGLTLAPWIPLIAITWAFESAYFGPDEQSRFEQALAEAREEGDAAREADRDAARNTGRGAGRDAQGESGGGGA